MSHLSIVPQVYAIDLLGFGASEFTEEFVDEPFVLVGNSIGSLVSLQAAKLRRDEDLMPQPCGIVLINCAGVNHIRSGFLALL